jgi:hypothetical protein
MKYLQDGNKSILPHPTRAWIINQSFLQIDLGSEEKSSPKIYTVEFRGGWEGREEAYCADLTSSHRRW